MTKLEILIYALLWLSFGTVHSLFARNSVKRVLRPLFGRTYRLVYNLFSALHIGLVIIGGGIMLGGNSVGFDLGRDLAVAAIICQVAGIIVIVASLTQYDMGRFTGVTQLHQGDDQAANEELLHLSGMHQYVRHPLYLGVYLYLVGGSLSEFGVQTALWGCLYLVIGTWFEERGLVAQFGQAYVEYKQKVPAVFPFKGRAIR
ncbi:MAG: isoprenylcysteine carboxylmethyltransferase family protein [Gammaproteobacteria bacterium]|nr:isoprenylcysteine carboxylmethyltransferase family protein [Gammaproteobacteria bacterium]MCZ6578927.1 isoprenylcysteine carboxylmethyltransferase family protein [Gammaproteobacteria bacterium]